MAYDPEQESSLTFGGVPDYVSSRLNSAVSHRVAGDNHWSLKLLDIRVADKSINLKAQFALTDTGTSLIYLDSIDYRNLIEAICADLNCFESKY